MHVPSRMGGWRIKKRTNDNGGVTLRTGGAKKSSFQTYNECYNVNEQTVVLCMDAYVRIRLYSVLCKQGLMICIRIQNVLHIRAALQRLQN